MLTYFIPSSTNLLLYYTTFSLITPRDYTLPHPIYYLLFYANLLESTLRYPIPPPYERLPRMSTG